MPLILEKNKYFSYKKNKMHNYQKIIYDEPIDFVIPWSGEPENDLSGINRNDGVIEYLVRSIRFYMSWIRYIIIFMDPPVKQTFLTPIELKKYGVRLVNRCEYFIDNNNCPSMNSFAIYANVHRIPFLSERYIMCDDDVTFSKPMSKEMFFHGKKINIQSTFKIKDLYPDKYIKKINGIKYINQIKSEINLKDNLVKLQN